MGQTYLLESIHSARESARCTSDILLAPVRYVLYVPHVAYRQPVFARPNSGTYSVAFIGYCSARCRRRQAEEDDETLFDVRVSYIEIYNEEIRDLLATEKNLKYDVKMTDSKGSDIYVTNLKVSTIVILVVNLTLVLSFLNTIHVTHKHYTRIKIFVGETGSKYITLTFLLP